MRNYARYTNLKAPIPINVLSMPSVVDDAHLMSWITGAGDRREITPSQYAKKIAYLEVEGEINQIKVAADIGYSYSGTEFENLNNLINAYSQDKSIDLRKRVKPGTGHLERYENDGEELREYYLKNSANIQSIDGVQDFQFDSNLAQKSKQGNYLIVKNINTGKKMNVVRDNETGKYSKYEK